MAKSTESSNIRTVGPKGAIKAITKAIAKRRPLFLWGPPGIGKSDIVKQIGDTTGREVIDIRLPLWEPTDIRVSPITTLTARAWCGLLPQNCLLILIARLSSS